jgi:Putative Actinobacterial Holin-X, holin superfamily III
MEDTFTKAEELAGHVKEYVNNRISAAKLNVAEKSSLVLANLIAGAIVLAIFIIFILFAGIALAYAFSKWTGEYYWGFLIVAGIYLLLGLLVWVGKARILQLPIMNSLLQQLFTEADNDEKN